MTPQELNFAYKVRHALDENAARLPSPVTERLARARRTAVSRKRKGRPLAILAHGQVFAGRTGNWFDASAAWLGRMGMAIPLTALALGLVGIYQFEQERRISHTAEIDAAVLADELPLAAYLDHGFNAYLAERDD